MPSPLPRCVVIQSAPSKGRHDTPTSLSARRRGKGSGGGDLEEVGGGLSGGRFGIPGRQAHTCWTTDSESAAASQEVRKHSYLDTHSLSMAADGAHSNSKSKSVSIVPALTPYHNLTPLLAACCPLPSRRTIRAYPVPPAPPSLQDKPHSLHQRHKAQQEDIEKPHGGAEEVGH